MSDDKLKCYGTWSVTTEGDEEGRSIRQLGNYTGYVDEIALHLANKCYYTLEFHPIDTTPSKNLVPKRAVVHIKFAHDVGEIPIDKVKTLFDGRPVSVEESNYYRSFELTYNKPEEIVIKNALAKLTDEEILILGLNKK